MLAAWPPAHCRNLAPPGDFRQTLPQYFLTELGSMRCSRYPSQLYTDRANILISCSTQNAGHGQAGNCRPAAQDALHFTGRSCRVICSQCWMASGTGMRPGGISVFVQVVSRTSPLKLQILCRYRSRGSVGMCHRLTAPSLPTAAALGTWRLDRVRACRSTQATCTEQFLGF